MYLWCANVFSRPLHAPGFRPSLSIDTHVPGILNEILDLEDGGKCASKVIRAFSLG